MSTTNTHYGALKIKEILEGKNSIFFIGIGGINMSSLALISKKMGYRVAGSDRGSTELTEKLISSGIEVFKGHNKTNIEGFEVVVYTVAISSDNPEYIRATELGIPLISRADYMGYLMTGYKNRIGISGMHGKSTCTSMCAEVFMTAGTDPTILSGAVLDTIGGAYRVGGEEYFIFEACEYMDSFLDFNPTLAIILNIEMDHVDYFHSMEQIKESFFKFAQIVGDYGCVVANYDDTEVREVTSNLNCHVISYGISYKNAAFTATNIRYENGCPSFDVMHQGEYYMHVSLSVIGEYNVYNALAVVVAAWQYSIDKAAVEEGLKRFRGAKRRMEYRGKLNGAAVYDDYGHHPTEVRSTINGIAKIECDRIWCVYQPHTYSRTSELLDEYMHAFDIADRVIIAPIYAAREVDTLGMSGGLLASKIGERAQYVEGFENIAKLLKNEVFAGDIIVIMGAGDIYRVFDYLQMDEEE